MTQAVILQHVEPEGPFEIASALGRAGLDVHVVRVDRGEAVPRDTSDLAALVVMGGPMSATSDEGFPTRPAELALLRAALDAAVPVLGVCLGAQLLAAAAGGRVVPGTGLEIGWAPVELTAAAASDPLFAGLPATLTVLHWHGDTIELPAGAMHLARSARYEHQAFRVGPNAWGLQFHVEVEADAVRRFVESFPEDAEQAPGGARAIVDAVPGVLAELLPARTALLDRFAALCRP